jgi:DNA-binding XRE family transcriptional regulator
MNADEFWAHVKRADGCWLWTGNFDSHGYGSLQYEGQKVGAHRVAWELTHGVIPADMCVCHRCDNPKCVNPEHLWLGTKSENALDRHVKGRSRGPEGIRQHDARLNLQKAEDIRAAYATRRYTQRALGVRYGVAQQSIGKIVNGRMWCKAAPVEARP